MVVPVSWLAIFDRGKKRMGNFKYFGGAVGALAVLGFAGMAHAGPVTKTTNIDFASPTESFWGPGQSAADFGYNAFLFGNTTFGMRFQTGASSGTVSSNYNGQLSVDYNDSAQAGLVNFGIGYQGDSNGGKFDTDLGAFAKATVYFPSPIPDGDIVDLNYTLEAGKTYTPSPADTNTDDDSFTPASTAFGPNVPVVGAAQAGIDYDITQNAKHTINSLDGTIRATNQRTGTVVSSGFSLGASQNVALNLDEWGDWEVELVNLSLDNLFETDFDLDLVAFGEYRIGDNCGDLGTDSDNNASFPYFGCVSDGRLEQELASFDLFSNTPFALDMTTGNSFQSFQVAVPEPATLGLFGLGLAGLGLAARRRCKTV